MFAMAAWSHWHYVAVERPHWRGVHGMTGLKVKPLRPLAALPRPACAKATKRRAICPSVRDDVTMIRSRLRNGRQTIGGA